AHRHFVAPGCFRVVSLSPALRGVPLPRSHHALLLPCTGTSAGQP
ncbi:unnamed protein product, partial [Urochloa humidicola]